jgi:hypothetical protein
MIWIAVDFDGTLCEERWPDIGEPKIAMLGLLTWARTMGARLILHTCREGALLDAALLWCRARHIHFDLVNANVPERVAQYGGDPRKISADVYIDDRAAGFSLGAALDAVRQALKKDGTTNDTNDTNHTNEAKGGNHE